MESEREGAELSVDGQPVAVPKTDTVKLTLPVRARPVPNPHHAQRLRAVEFNRVRSKAKTNLTTP